MESKKEEIFLFTGRDPSNIKLSGKVVHYPLINTEAVEFEVEDIGTYEGIIFTSRMAVKAFCGRYRIGDDQKVFAVGPHTKRELEGLRYIVDYMPDIANSDELARFIEGLNIGKLFYPTSDISKNRLSHLDNVKSVIAYTTKPLSQPQVALNDYAGVIFSSPSTVDSFLAIYGVIPEHLRICVYGQKTANRLRREGYEDNVEIIKV